MDLDVLCENMKRAPGMYVPDGRYVSAVAFIEGFNAALDGEPLRGFDGFIQGKLNDGKRSSVRWSQLIMSMEGSTSRGNVPPSLDKISSESDKILTERMLDLILEFLEKS